MWHVFWNVKLLRRKLQKQLYFVVNCILFKGVEIEVEEFLCSKTVTSTMLVMSRTATVSFGSCCCSQSYPIWGTDVIVPKARGQKREGSASLPWTKCVKNLRELVWSITMWGWWRPWIHGWRRLMQNCYHCLGKLTSGCDMYSCKL